MDAIVVIVLEQLATITRQQIQQEVNPVFGVRKEVERLTNSFQAIKDVLVDAEERQVKDTSVRAWLCRLNDVSYNAEDVLDKWNTSMLKLQIERAENALTLKKKACFFLSHCICFRQAVLHHDISGKIREINESLDDIAKDKERYNFNILQSVEQPQGVESISFIDEHTVYGRDEEKKLFISKLMCESSDEHQSLKIISIVGMGGMGKTTLAQLAFNDYEVKNVFQKRIWVCVSNPFNKLRVANAILHGLEGQTSSSATLQSALEKIHQSIVQKKILFILDDVWTEDYNDWEPLYNCLKNCLNGSKIVVTTRNEKVALMMKSIVIPIKELAENEIWSLFKHFAFYNWSHDERRELEDVGMEIVSKCKGLPLAAKTMGSLLHFKRTRREWKIILDSEMWVLKEFEKNIFAPLLLSYYDLPPMVKRCFLYCVIFSKDYQLDEEELIKLWMAQGYLKGKRNSTKEMEMIGADYLNILYTRSFFMKDQICTTKRLKIHDIVHDFAQFLTNNESFAMNDKDFVASSINLSFEKVHHLMLMVDNSSSFPNSICNFKKLRSLLMKFESGMYSIDGVLLQLLSQNTSLRALALCGTFEYESMINKISMRVVAVAKIPREIGKLICLRYLDLSNNWGLEMLPETICELYNLQTLNVSWCQNLKELPQGMGKLINLRHLENEQTNSLRYMPKGIEKLTCLRTLNEFHVSECNYGRKACSLECLNKFHHLEGLLGIHGLGNLTDVNEAQKIDLANKENIRGLRLGFNGFNSRKNEAIFEALQPPPNLRGLHVLKYAGNTMLPNWPTSLINLTRLDLIEWINCEQLPQLGKLPSLQTLCIERMKKVKRVGHELLGLESDEITSSLSVTVFPQLQYLYFWRMVEWEEWDFGIENHNIIVMPSLHTLEIAECPKLKVLPKEILHVPPQVLSINNSPVVRDRYRKLEGDHWSEISHIPNIVIDEEYIQRDGR